VAYRFLLESASPITLVEDQSVPPEPPEPPAPPADPPPDPDPEDERPFVWPPDILTPGTSEERAKVVWMIPGRADDAQNARIRGYLSNAGKPDPAQFNAGIIQAGHSVGLRVWAPKDAPPGMLRAILSGLL